MPSGEPSGEEDDDGEVAATADDSDRSFARAVPATLVRPGEVDAEGEVAARPEMPVMEVIWAESDLPVECEEEHEDEDGPARLRASGTTYSTTSSVDEKEMRGLLALR